MEEYIREHFSEKLDLPPVEGESTIFEYFIDDKGKWIHWNERVYISYYFFLSNTQKWIVFGRLSRRENFASKKGCH